MKKIKILIALIYSFPLTVMAIDDASFKNNDKYRMLTLTPIGTGSVVNIAATFYPPEGKKVNSASMIRLWEKTGKEWQIADKVYADNETSLLSGNQLNKSVTIKTQGARHALEVDFIHCDYQGGQCQMQKYLSPVQQSKKSLNQLVKMKLKLGKD